MVLSSKTASSTLVIVRFMSKFCKSHIIHFATISLVNCCRFLLLKRISFCLPVLKIELIAFATVSCFFVIVALPKALKSAAKSVASTAESG